MDKRTENRISIIISCITALVVLIIIFSNLKFLTNNPKAIFGFIFFLLIIIPICFKILGVVSYLYVSHREKNQKKIKNKLSAMEYNTSWINSFEDINDKDLIETVYIFMRNIYIEELKKFNYKKSDLIDNYLNPIDHERLLNNIETTRLKLNTFKPVLLNKISLKPENTQVLKIGWQAIIEETEEKVIEKFLESNSIRLSKLVNNDIPTKKNDRLHSKAISKSNPDEKSTALYFYKYTASKKGIITTTIPLVDGNIPNKNIKYGFTAINLEFALKANFEVGDKLPLELTNKEVVNPTTGEIIPDMYWAH